MGKFSLYNIPLKNLTETQHTFEYKLNNEYFKLIGDSDSDIKKGNIDVSVTVKRISNHFDINFFLKGNVFVPCDRCLDELNVEVDTNNHLIVKFGHEYSEENDEIIIIPEDEGELNIAWFLFEFIALSLPMKKVHPSGKCNKIMSSKLNKHKATSTDEESDNEEENDTLIDDEDIGESVDPRWDTLKGLSTSEEDN